ncbi:hypothetical protein EI94DRAFT_1152075 [Lactarius quietus]|nr:hypothetical protein EI94DRAFT_1152075 [Lactarius quietus]
MCAAHETAPNVPNRHSTADLRLDTPLLHLATLGWVRFTAVAVTVCALRLISVSVPYYYCMSVCYYIPVSPVHCNLLYYCLFPQCAVALDALKSRLSCLECFYCTKSNPSLSSPTYHRCQVRSLRSSRISLVFCAIANCQLAIARFHHPISLLLRFRIPLELRPL